MNKRNTVIYTGVTNDIERRIGEHKFYKVKGFTQKYNIDRLVYFEKFGHPQDAIRREKEIKGWTRDKKLILIKKGNPNFDDLAKDWNLWNCQ